mmetsp:Transcript_10763/g.31360  ORF Transcript_10763/g.31360 Transcript_10763/m.31360 type:complete len:627 (-) Transcript_10763:843-2723(-)
MEQQQQGQTSYGGRWVFDNNKERMVFIVEQKHPPIPSAVIPLPRPPSECGSVYMSDGSLTVSQHFGHDESNTFEDDSLVGSSYCGDDDDDSLRNAGTDKIADSSTANETEESSDIEGQADRITQWRSGQRHAFVTNKTKKKKKVTLILPEEEEKRQRRPKSMQKSKSNCCRIALYFLFGLSLLVVVVGGGLSAMIHFDVISTDQLNFLDKNNHYGSSTTVEDNVSPDTTETSSPWSSDVTDFPETTINPVDGATVAPGSSVERGIITNILEGQFSVTFSDFDQSSASNRAVNWMANELKSFSSSRHGEANNGQGGDYFYNDLAKFGQRFAILAVQYSLIDGIFFGFNEGNSLPFEQRRGVDECDWEGVGCDDYGRVVELDFSDYQLIGSIPSEIRILSNLQILDLSSNGIFGSIPEDFYELRDLKRVYLYHNKLTGTISSSIGQLNSLQYLHLSHNSLSGSIPQQLRSWSHDVFRPLRYLNLYDNRLTGTIPTNLKLRDLFYFDIGRNSIGGSIPGDIGTDFMELRYLHIDHNRLTQNIPDTIPPMANGRLLSFLANNNRLQGNVPDNWTMFNKLVQYTLHDNYFNYLGPANCYFNVFEGGQLVEFKAECDICSCNDIFCDAMCRI